MEVNGHSFLSKVFNIVKEELREDAPLIKFEHPKDLEKILQLDLSEATDEKNLERCVRQILQYSVKTNKPTFRNQLYGATDPYGLSAAWITEAFNTSQDIRCAQSSKMVQTNKPTMRNQLYDAKDRDCPWILAKVISKYTFEVAPAFTLIENKVLSHVLELFGIRDGDGIFSPGGSLSMLYGIVAARYRAFPEVKTKGMWGLPQMVLYTSEDSHYSIKKAAHWLGFGTESIRIIKTNAKGQMIVEELEAAILKDKKVGIYPLLVNATAGTTVLGAIDPLPMIADVCKKYAVWMHVDACWGGSLILSRKHKVKLNGIERANSVSWNPHKMAGAPLQCSLFLVRERGLLHEANSASAQYLFQQDKFYDVSYDTGDKSVQCGRKIDAFKLWMMWKARGDSGFDYLADHTMQLAQFCLDAVKTRPGFRLVVEELQCPNVCFWYIPKRLRGEEEDEKWWKRMHKIIPKIKENLTKKSLLMVSYSPLREHKNFFRLALTFHPVLQEAQILKMLGDIEQAGEEIELDC